MKRNWKIFCINCRKVWRELFSTQYQKRKIYQKRTEEIIAEIMAEQAIAIRLKMVESIYLQVKKRTIKSLEESVKNNEVELMMKSDENKRSLELINKIKQNANSSFIT